MDLYKAHYKAHYIYGLQILRGQFSDIKLLILNLKASTDSDLFKLFGSSSYILAPKYSKEFNPQCALPVITTMALWQLLHLGT